ncbi:unnamed protein product [Polarella glacialis]|uniref:Uncharacterized protein n=1 Tax=Polarella glacialis TaxID=89957 RepID=A0A813HYE6_POLGL|nr:unnamed protein product [Polarella glacialis]
MLGLEASGCCGKQKTSAATCREAERGNVLAAPATSAEDCSGSGTKLRVCPEAEEVSATCQLATLRLGARHVAPWRQLASMKHSDGLDQSDSQLGALVFGASRVGKGRESFAPAGLWQTL